MVRSMARRLVAPLLPSQTYVSGAAFPRAVGALARSGRKFRAKRMPLPASQRALPGPLAQVRAWGA